jgi:preprotein translocase subunit SecD
VATRSSSSAARPARTLILLIVLIGAVFGSLAAGVRWSDASWTPNLALDLEGGTQIILEPQVDNGAEITDRDIEQAIEVIRQRVDSSGVSEAEITSQGGQNIVVALPGEPDEATLDLVRQSAQMRFRVLLVEDAPNPVDPAMATPTDPTEVPTGGPTEEPTDGATEEPTEPADGSTDGAGVVGSNPGGGTSMMRPAQTDTPTDEATETPTEPATDEATEAPADEPTEDATQDATPPTREEIEAAAFTLADSDQDGELSTEPATEPTSASDQAWITEQVAYDFYVLDCTDPANRIGGGGDDPDAPLVTCSQDGTAKYILGPSELEGTDIASASSGLRTNDQGQVLRDYAVFLEFTNAGGRIFSDVTARLAGLASTGQNRFAIVLDTLVISSPSVDEQIPNGQASITGGQGSGFTQETSATLANQLSFGALPINFTVQSEEQISATLGSEQLQRGLLAGLIGLVLVVLYSLAQYRGLALVTVASLIVAGLLTYGVISVLSWVQGYRLSLPGVAGLIVAIGITADSFVVYFERIRDEVREGRRLDVAVEQGWKRARRTILASDAVNLLAAAVLYFLAVGGVRGFAFTLGLTTLIDLAVVFCFTHPMMQLLVRTKFFGQGHKLSGLDPRHLGSTVAPVYRGRGSFRSPAEREPRPAGGTIAERRAAAAKAHDADDDADLVGSSKEER